jgi:hypothetical protein
VTSCDKYDGKTGWSLIFGRLLVGWLEARAGGDPPDLIVADPTYTGPGGPAVGHVGVPVTMDPSAPLERPVS